MRNIRGQEQLALQPARTTRAAAVCTSAAAVPLREHAPARLILGTITSTEEHETGQCQRVMVHRALIDPITDNGDAKQFCNWILPAQQSLRSNQMQKRVVRDLVRDMSLFRASRAALGATGARSVRRSMLN
ncbi:hypothetical protein ACJJTC_000564 [Scirpophaga incertulas]